MIKKIEPDYYIVIGIKGKKVVEVDWSDLYMNRFEIEKQHLKQVKDYLKQAIKFLK